MGDDDLRVAVEKCQACREGVPDYIAPCSCPVAVEDREALAVSHARQHATYAMNHAKTAGDLTGKILSACLADEVGREPLARKAVARWAHDSAEAATRAYLNAREVGRDLDWLTAHDAALTAKARRWENAAIEAHKEMSFYRDRLDAVKGELRALLFEHPATPAEVAVVGNSEAIPHEGGLEEQATVEEREALAWDNDFKRAVNVGIDNFRMGRRSNDGLAQDLAEAILASDWLTAHDARVRAEGHREAATAIDFDTTCVSCAKVIERSYSAWSDGHTAGRADALREAAEAWATGEWADAFGADGVTDDESAVRAMEKWLLARADREQS